MPLWLAARIVAVDTTLKNGAIGFTTETGALLYVKRVHLLNFLGDTLREQRAAMM